jgi:PAS domain S-box-containing protein
MALPSDTRILEAWLDFSAEVLCVLDAQGHVLRISSAGARLLGCAPAELVGQDFASLVDPADRAAVAQRGLVGAFDCRCLRKAGPPLSLAWAVRPVAGGDEVLAVGRPLLATTEPRPFNHVLIEHGFDMVAVLDRQGVYTYVGGATERVLGYRPEEMIGQPGLDFVHPEDLPAIRASLAALCTQAVLTMPEFRFRAANGEWKWLQSTASSQLANPDIQAFTLSSRDVTEQRRKDCELAKSEQRFRLLFDNDLTLTTFQTADGRVLDANQALLTFLKKEKHELLAGGQRPARAVRNPGAAAGHRHPHPERDQNAPHCQRRGDGHPLRHAGHYGHGRRPKPHSAAGRAAHYYPGEHYGRVLFAG